MANKINSRLVARGYSAMKFDPFPDPWRAYISRRDEDIAVERVAAVREAVGPDVELMADAYMGWDVTYAIRMIRMIEEAGIQLKWIEEPVIPDDIDGYARIRRSVSTPISGGEHEFTRYGFRELIQKEAVDILQPDVNRVGGITEARKIWALAACHGIPVIPHAGQAHNYHLVISHMNSPIAEYFPDARDGGVLDDDTLFHELFVGEPRAVDGHVRLPDVPGLGLELNEKRIREWTFGNHDRSHTGTATETLQ